MSLYFSWASVLDPFTLCLSYGYSVDLQTQLQWLFLQFCLFLNECQLLAVVGSQDSVPLILAMISGSGQGRVQSRGSFQDA